MTSYGTIRHALSLDLKFDVFSKLELLRLLFCEYICQLGTSLNTRNIGWVLSSVQFSSTLRGFAVRLLGFPSKDFANQLKHSDIYRKAMRSKNLSHQHKRFVTPKTAEHFSGLPENWTSPGQMVTEAAFQNLVPPQAGVGHIMCKRSTKFVLVD